MFISATAFFLFEAKSVYEFGATLYASLTEFLTFVIFNIILCKMPEISSLIENLENFIRKSK